MYDQSHADVCFIRGEYESAAEQYLDGAESGIERASYNYAYCLLHGLGVAYDPKSAKSFFSYARYMEGGEAAYQLAMLYMHGCGVARDYRAAIEYMRESASRGCIEAQLYLGMAYTTGCVIEPEIIGISMIPYHKAEVFDPATPLLDGDVPDAAEDEEKRFSVISADAGEAFRWFRAAAHHDPTYVKELVAKGQYLYAKCYVDGMGTDHDNMKAARLMIAAGRSGSEEAVAYLAEQGITKEMLLAAGKRRSDG